jgi:hypothetical protein
LNWSHEFLLPVEILFHFNLLREGFSQILIILLSDLFLYNFLYGIEMIILEHIIFEIIELLITEGTSMMPINRLFNTWSAIYMPASRYVTVIDGIEANRTLELSLKPLWTDLEVNVILLFYHH